MPRRARSISVVVTLLVLACASCTDADDPPSSVATPRDPSPQSSPSSSSPSASSPRPEPVPPYLKGYTPRERRAYGSTVAAYADFTRQQAQILAIGRAVPEARRYYRAQTGDRLTYWNRLRQREADGIKIKGQGELLRVRPARIRLANDATGTVDLRACGVARGVKVFQNGELIPQPTPAPKIVSVRLVRLTSQAPWKVFWERVGGSC